MPEISVIIPVYNVEQYLRQCIESVVHQTFRDLEILLIDDGSTDSSAAICREYEQQDPRIKVIQKKNGGLSDARNAGLDAATGRYIGFVDSDDYIDPDMYELLHGNALRHQADISMCRDRRVPSLKDDYDLVGTKVYVYTTIPEMIKAIFLSRKTSMAVCLKIYRREIFSQLRFSKGLTSEDADIILDTLSCCRGLAIQDVSKYNYRRRIGSITQQPVYTPKILDLGKVYQKNYERIISDYPELREVGEYRLWWAYREMLARIGATSDVSACADIIRKIQGKLRRHIRNILHNPYMSMGQRIATVLAMSSCRLYARLKGYV